MSKNDVVLLDTVLKTRRDDAPAHLTEDQYFEYFVCEQALKDYEELLPDDLLEGMIGGSLDGGIDGLFSFEGDRLLQSDSDLDRFDRGDPLTLYVLQAKRSGGFQEAPLQLIEDTLGDMLDLSMTRTQLERKGLYSDALIARADIFRNALTQLANKHPTVRVFVVYGSKGDTNSVSKGANARAKHLKRRVETDLTGSQATVVFLGARELLDQARREPSRTLELPFEASMSDDQSYSALVTLRGYFDFITDEGTLRRYLFEGNVRDYQGEVEVNKGIRQSLQNARSPQFWWLNNGITVVCSGISITGKRFFIDEPEIVNGLQTSMMIFEHFSTRKRKSHENAFLLIRLIHTTDLQTRDTIIRATNNQTKVALASLHATEKLQRDIEIFFRSRAGGQGLVYDRRRNHYRVQGYAADRIISIEYLAQAVMAICLSQPDQARARPTTYLRNNYERVFSENRPLSVYLWAAQTQKAVDSFLRSQEAATTAEERLNLRFHLSMFAVANRLGHRVRNEADLNRLVHDTFSSDELNGWLKTLRRVVRTFQKRAKDTSMDRASKSADFVEYLLKSYFPEAKRQRKPRAKRTAATI